MRSMVPFARRCIRPGPGANPRGGGAVARRRGSRGAEPRHLRRLQGSRAGTLAACALTLLLAACASSAADEDNPFRPDVFQPRGGEIDIVVENLNFADATLMAMHEGGRTRLGTVGGKSSGQFRIAWPSPRNLRIRINLLASDQFTTQPMSVGPGDRVSLTIETVLTRSHMIR